MKCAHCGSANFNWARRCDYCRQPLRANQHPVGRDAHTNPSTATTLSPPSATLPPPGYVLRRGTFWSRSSGEAAWARSFAPGT